MVLLKILVLILFSVAAASCRCREHCFYRYTGMVPHGGGRVFYLARLHPQCPTGSALRSFVLQRVGHHRIRYRSICCRFTRSICRNYRRYSSLTYANQNSNAKRLTSQLVNCPHYAYVSGFGLQRYGHRIRYTFNCCFLRRIADRRRSTCYARVTGWTPDGRGSALSLARQRVLCHSRYFVSYFRLQRKTGSCRKGSFRYHYRCCKIR